MNEETKAPERVTLSRYANGGMTMTAPDGSNHLNRAWGDRYVRTDLYDALEAELTSLRGACRDQGERLDQALALLPDSRMLLDQAASLIELLQGPSVGSEKLRALRDRITAFLESFDTKGEPTDEWRASVDRVRRLTQEMQSGMLGTFHDDLLPLAGEALACAKARDNADQVAWAKALASDVANIADCDAFGAKRGER